MSNHGSVTKDGLERYCNFHGKHSILYVCEKYSKEIKDEIKFQEDKFHAVCPGGEFEKLYFRKF